MERKITVIAPKKELIPKRIKVAAYARVSNGKDAMLHSLSAQISHYSSLIQSHGEWQFSGVYADEAISGTKNARPEFQRLINDCKDGKIDMIITKSISRFARNTVTLLETIRMLKGINIDVYFEEQNIHSMSGDGELMLTILASYAQEESLTTSENIKWRIRNDFKQGKLPMCIQKLYGYQRTPKGGFKIIEEEAKVIQYIVHRYLNGAGFYKISNELNSMGIKSPAGGQWEHKAIRRLLTNEKNIGDLLLQKTFRPNHLSKFSEVNTGQLDMYYIQDNHEGIISRTDFEEIQEEMQYRAQKNKCRESGKTYPFSGMIHCENCGANYNRKVSNCSNKYRRVFWNCATFLHQGKSVCHTKQIPEDELIRLSCKVLKIEEFDEKLFKEKISEIRIPSWYNVTFVFFDGTSITQKWEDKSRKWTDEMKAENYYNLRRRHGI